MSQNLSQICWIEPAKDPGFEHSFATKIIITVIASFSAISAMIVQKNIYKLLQRKTGRGINRFMIIYSIMLFYIIPLSYGYLTLTAWVKAPYHYISTYGCYVVAYSSSFTEYFAHSYTFFISLFRYLCVNQSSQLTKFNIGDKELGLALPAAQALISVAYTLASLQPSSPESYEPVLKCLGKDTPLFFYYDYFIEGGHKRKKQYCAIENVFGRYTCYGTLGLALFIGSNACEVFFLGSIMYSMKQQFVSVSHMLSPGAREQRRRENGTVFAITFWQWIVEVFASILWVFSVYIRGHNRLLDHSFALIFYGIYEIVVPSFSFLADESFRTALHQKGILKAIWLAMTQSY